MGLTVAGTAPAGAVVEELPCAPPTPAPIALAPRAVARIAPVARAEWQWRIRMDEARMAKLEQLKRMLAHVIPDGDLDRILDRMLDDGLAVEGKRRGFVAPSRRREPAPTKPPTPGERAFVPRDVRREVLKRDGYRCTWVHPDGSRCEAASRLEMDHLEPARETGSSRPADLTIRCRHHNQLRAFRRYGRAYVRRRLEEAREARRAARPITGAAARVPAPLGSCEAAMGA